MGKWRQVGNGKGAQLNIIKTIRLEIKPKTQEGLGGGYTKGETGIGATE